MRRPIPGCTGKVAYPTKVAAMRAQRELETKRNHQGLEVYHCRCGAFHLGTARPHHRPEEGGPTP